MGTAQGQLARTAHAPQSQRCILGPLFIDEKRRCLRAREKNLAGGRQEVLRRRMSS